MTLKEQIASDVSTVFLNTDDFAEVIGYIAHDSEDPETPAEIRAHVQHGQQAPRPNDRGRTMFYPVAIWVSVADVPSIVLRKDIFIVPPRAGEDPECFTIAEDMTPPNEKHMRKLGLVRTPGTPGS